MSELPNIVLVTADSVRADHCGFTGASYDTTPNLDAMADEALVFENAIAPGPRTPSSMPEIFTGVRLNRPEQAGWERRYANIRRHLGAHRTLPERLQELGYATIGFTANPWTHETSFDKGFDAFRKPTLEDGRTDAKSLGLRTLEQLMRVERVRDLTDWNLKRAWFVQWPQYYEEIVETVEAADPPYFLWVFLLDAHQPYITPRAYRKETTAPEMYYATLGQYGADSIPDRVASRLRRAYRDAIRSVDAFVGRLSADLDATFVFHSDHGEAFGEHGVYGHEETLYEENLRVPLLVQDVDEGRVHAPYSLRNLPTLVGDIATSSGSSQVSMESAGAEDGVVLPTPNGGETAWFRNGTGLDPGAGACVYARTEFGDCECVRSRRWKYIADGEGSELYDLAEDPGERVECRNAHPSVVETLEAALRRVQSQLAEQRAIRAGAGEVAE